jgi:hypothetical protein
MPSTRYWYRPFFGYALPGSDINLPTSYPFNHGCEVLGVSLTDRLWFSLPGGNDSKHNILTRNDNDWMTLLNKLCVVGVPICEDSNLQAPATPHIFLHCYGPVSRPAAASDRPVPSIGIRRYAKPANFPTPDDRLSASSNELNDEHLQHVNIIAEDIEPGHPQNTASTSRGLQNPPQELLDKPYSVAKHDVTLPVITPSTVRPAEQVPSITLIDINDAVDADDRLLQRSNATDLDIWRQACVFFGHPLEKMKLK